MFSLPLIVVGNVFMALGLLGTLGIILHSLSEDNVRESSE